MAISSICFLVVMLVYTMATPDARLRFHSCNVEANERLAEANCTLTTRFGESKISTFVNVLSNISAIRAQTRLNLFLPLGNPVTLIDHVEPDLCVQFQPSSVASLLVAALNEFRDVGHLPEQCPVIRGHYYIKDLFIPSSFLPAYLPPGDFQLELKMHGTTENSEVLLFYDLSIRVSIEQSEEPIIGRLLPMRRFRYSRSN